MMGGVIVIGVQIMPVRKGFARGREVWSLIFVALSI